MSIMECHHCRRCADARSMQNCDGCGGMICPECVNENECPGEDMEC